MLSFEETCEQLKVRLKDFYKTKKFLPKILEDEDFSEHKIEDTYVNLMLIEVEKGQGKDDGSKGDGKGEKTEKTYGAYEEIVAKKTEIDLKNIFDSKSHSDKSTKEVSKVLIYGRAGIGKTTLCNYISYKWAQPSGLEKEGFWQGKFEYVFWLPLRDLNGGWHKQYKKTELREYPLECFINRYCLSRDVRFSIQDISNVIKEGNVLLILDGYDEIASFHNEKHTVIKDVINSAIGITNKQARILMTSRPNAVGISLVGKFDAEIENVGLKKEDVYGYIEKYKFKGTVSKESLTRLVKQHAHIESIAGVPINLYLLCLIWDKGGLKNQAYITTTGLYEEVSAWLMKRYLSKFKEKGLDEINYDEAGKVCEEECKLLEELAYCGVKNKTAILRKEGLLALDIKWDKLNELKELGILSGKGVEKGANEYEFIHLTFQEYFAAKHVVKLLSGDLQKIKEAVKFINENKYNRVYERVILFISGLVTLGFEKRNNKQAMLYFWDVILNGCVDLGAIKQVGLLIRCLEEGKCSEEIPGIDKVLEVIKQYSLKHVGKLKDSLNISTQVLCRVIENLTGELEKPYVYGRLHAASALGKLELGDTQLTKTVAESLYKALGDHDKDVRLAAACALGKLKLGNGELTKTVVEILCEALGGHDKDGRHIAIFALGKLKLDDAELTKTVAEALCKALGGHDKDVCRNAASALGKLELGDTQLTKTVVEALCKALGDHDAWVRHAAASALGELKLGDVELTKPVVEALFKALGAHDKDGRLGAASALGKLKLDDAELTKTVIEALFKALGDPDKDVRYAAVYALGELKLGDVELTKTAVEALFKALGDPDKDVRYAAVYALGKLKLDDAELTKTAVGALFKALRDSDKYVRRTAASALGELKLDDAKLTKTVVEALFKALGDPDKDVRLYAASALGELKLDDAELTKTAVEALCRALGDSYGYDLTISKKLNKALEKCAINSIKLPFTKHSIKLLALPFSKILQESAIILSSNYLTLYYGDHKLVFEFDRSDKELPSKVLEVFKKKAEKDKLPTDMLDNLSARHSWISIDGIHSDIEKLTSYKIIEEIDMKSTISKELELNFEVEAQHGIRGDLLQVCTKAQTVQWLKGKYKGQKESPILIVAMELVNDQLLHYQVLVKTITDLTKEGIGMKFKDESGNFIEHYAVKYWNQGGEKLMDECLKGHYDKFGTVNKYGVNILHIAVCYGYVEKVCNKVKVGNLDFSKKAEIGGYALTPMETAAGLGEIEAIKQVCNATKQVPSTSLFGGNILNLAIEFGRNDVLHHLLHWYKIESRLVQDAYVYASIVDNKGNINSLRIIQRSFKNKYEDCSVDQWGGATGNTALHAVVANSTMKGRDKIKIITYLLEQKSGLIDSYNRGYKRADALTEKQKIQRLLKTQKVIQDAKKYEIPEIWETPIRNLVFKGGGPKGVVYTGALKALEVIQKEKELEEIERVGGTSAGAITAGLYAIGYSGEELERDLASISLMSLLDNKNIESILKIQRSNKNMQGKINDLMKEKGVEGKKIIFELIGTLGDKGGLCSGEECEKILEGLIYKKTNKHNFTLGDLRTRVKRGEKGYKDLCVVTLNIVEGGNSLIVLSSDNPSHRNIRLTDAIRASMSIPIVFAPKEIKYFEENTGEEIKLRCVDGGMIYNYPVDIFDKVKYQHTGIIASKSERPEYNQYTLGLSIYNSSESSNNLNNNVSNRTVVVESETIEVKLIKVCQGLSIWLAGGNPFEVVNDMKKLVEQVKPIIEVLKEGESVRNEYWSVSDEKRTIKIDCKGVGLMDFDLSEEKIKEMIAGGEEAVQEAFDERLQKAKRESQVAASIGNITQKSSSQKNPNASTSLSTQSGQGQGAKIQDSVTKVNPTQQQKNEETSCLVM